MPCQNCQDSESKPVGHPEFTTDSIRDQRREFRKDTIQPFRSGVVSKEYIEEYGTSGLNIDKKHIDNAEYVWKDLSNWHDRDKSKGGAKK